MQHIRPSVLAQKVWSNLKPLKSVPDAKGAQGGNLSRIAREDPLTRLGVKKMRKGTESTPRKGQRDTLPMPNSQVAKIGGSDEVRGKFNPSSSPVELAG